MAYTHSRNISGQSWADIVDEVASECYNFAEGAGLPLAKSACDRLSEATADDMVRRKAALHGDSSGATLSKEPLGDLPSIGSVDHKTGRCKPCAFLHTKGCMNGSSCEFCHLCSAHEKLRRKRLRRNMYEKLSRRGDAPDGEAHHSFKFGHARQFSGTSTTSTRSTCSNVTRLSHSRQSSSSSEVASSTDIGPNSQMDHMSMDSARESMPMLSELEERAQASGAAISSEEPPAMTISLAQVLPSPSNRQCNTASHTLAERPAAGNVACASVGPVMNVCAGAGPVASSNGFAQLGPMNMPSSSMQLPGNVVIVAVAVPVQVSRQSNLQPGEPNMPYVCAPQQQCPPPMHGGPPQWLMPSH